MRSQVAVRQESGEASSRPTVRVVCAGYRRIGCESDRRMGGVADNDMVAFNPKLQFAQIVDDPTLLGSHSKQLIPTFCVYW